MSLPLTDKDGRIFALANGTPTFRNAGIGFTPSGQMCTTTMVSADDRFTRGGWRVDQLGRVVVGDATSGGQPFIRNGGLPFSKLNGALVRQVDTTPAATDPYVAGIRVGPLGGCYMSTSPVPARLTAAMRARLYRNPLIP